MKKLFLFVSAAFVACSMEQKTENFHYDLNGMKYNIPRVEGISIDGNASDWENQGLDCPLLCNYSGNKYSSGDIGATVCIGWNDSALLVKADVADDTIVTLGKKNLDGIELFMIDKTGGKNKLQYIINLNKSLSGKAVDIAYWDHRGSRKLAGTPMFINATARINDKGYCIEAAIPLRYIGLEAAKDNEIGFEIVVNDVDNDESKKVQLAWNYLKDAYMNNFALNRLILSEGGRESVPVLVRACIVDRKEARIVLCGKKEMAGKTVVIRDTGNILAECIMKDTNGLAMAEFSMPYQNDSMYLPLAAFVDCSLAGVVDLNIANPEFRNTREYPYESYIRILLRKQHLNPAPENPILFIGHSMFRYWHMFDDDMQGFTAVNRAFGGSKSDQVVFWYDKVVKPYNPKAIVYFEGANDFHTGVPVAIFMAHVKTFVEKVESDFPKCKLFILSPDIRDEHPEYNSEMKKFLKKHPEITYINMEGFKAKMGAASYQTLLLPDNTHWNAKGYSMLAPIIREYLKEFKN